MEMLLLAVTLISLTVAIATSVLAWRLMRDERLRSEARITALAADIGDDDRTVAIGDPEATAVTERPLRGEPATLPGGMFAAAAPSPSRLRPAAVVAAGAVVMASAIGALVMTSGRGTTAAIPAAARDGLAAESPARAGAAGMPLELVALGHEREADRLTVRGVVRNPPAAADVNRLTAVVLLFNREGGFIASGRAEVNGAGVAPGAERTFVVSVAAGGEIARYRVSFRSEEHVIPHVDKRKSVIENLQPRIRESAD